MNFLGTGQGTKLQNFGLKFQSPFIEVNKNPDSVYNQFESRPSILMNMVSLYTVLVLINCGLTEPEHIYLYISAGRFIRQLAVRFA